MALSFLDLPVEVMLLVISYIDTVPTLHSVLSTKKVRYQLAGHFKIVLDYPDKQPKMFPFHDVFEVIRVPSLSPTQRASSIFYLAEIDMTQQSFHSNTFYPDESGIYSKLKPVLSGYASGNVALCLSVSPPGSSWSDADIEMASLDPLFVALFNGLKFQAVHVLPSGRPLRSTVFDYKKRITSGEVLTKQVAHLLDKGAEHTLTRLSLQFPSWTLLMDHCIKYLGTISRIEIATHSTEIPKKITGDILAKMRMIYPLKDLAFERLHRADIGVITKLDNVTIKMAPDAPAPQDFLRSLHIDNFEWQFTVKMMSSPGTGKTGFAEVKPPSINSLSSKTLASLSIETYSQIPNMSHIDLPNLSALSLIYHNSTAPQLLSFITWDTFITSKIQYLRVDDVRLLKKCFFATNLTRLEGLILTNNHTYEEFGDLIFPHLHILLVESVRVPSTTAPNLKRLQWTCAGDAAVDTLPKFFPNLIELEIHDQFEEWNWCEYTRFKKLKMFTWAKLPHAHGHGSVHARTEENFTVCSSGDPKWVLFDGHDMWTTKICTFVNDILHLDDVSLLVSGLDSVEHIVLTNVKDLSISGCPNLKMITDTCNEGQMRIVKLSFGLPNLQFVTYKSDSRAHHVDRSIKHRVFIRRVDEKERTFYYVHERSEELEAEDGEGDSDFDSDYELPDVVVVEREYTSLDRVLKKYGAEVEGLKDWLLGNV